MKPERITQEMGEPHAHEEDFRAAHRARKGSGPLSRSLSAYFAAHREARKNIASLNFQHRHVTGGAQTKIVVVGAGLEMKCGAAFRE